MQVTSGKAGKLLYGGIRTLYFGIVRRKKAQKAQKSLLIYFVSFVPFCGSLLVLFGGELFGHADEVGEGVGVHFFHDLAAMEFDGDFARA